MQGIYGYIPETIKFLGYIVVTGCGRHSAHRHHYLKGYRCHHFGQHHDMYIIRVYNIFYNTTSKHINPDTCLVQWKKLVHQSIVHKLLLKNYHKESLITFHSRIFPSLEFTVPS